MKIKKDTMVVFGTLKRSNGIIQGVSWEEEEQTRIQIYLFCRIPALGIHVYRLRLTFMVQIYD
jgi:hypothetical protein